MKRKVAIVQARLHHYRMPFYECLRTKLAEMDIALSLIHGGPSPHERGRSDDGYLDWAIRIKNTSIYLGGNECLWQPCLRYIRGQDLVVVQQENRMLVNYWLLLGRLVSRQRVAFWGHGVNCQSHQPRGLKETWKRFLSTLPDWWFAYTDVTKKILVANAVPAQRITVVNNAVDTSSLRAFLADIRPDELAGLRRRLGLAGANVGIYCGSLYEDKRVEFLVEAAERIRTVVGDFELIILGAGPDAWKATEAGRRNPYIHYVGPQSGRDKAAFLKLGHVFMMPGAVGLAILDGLVAGLPLITTDCKRHGPEISYLRQGRNGFSTADNMDDYVAAVVRVLRDRSLLSCLSRWCIADGDRYTIEDMASRFAAGVLEALDTDNTDARSIGAS